MIDVKLVIAERDALAARAAELEAENDERRIAFDDALNAMREQIAHANALRDALEKALSWGLMLGTADPEWVAQARAALAAHPAASLVAHDAEVIERCAKVADECGGVCANELDAHQCAEAIRALAAQAQEVK